MTECVTGVHAVVRNELFLHRDSILAKLRKLPGCAEIKGLALRSGVRQAGAKHPDKISLAR